MINSSSTSSLNKSEVCLKKYLTCDVEIPLGKSGDSPANVSQERAQFSSFVASIPHDTHSPGRQPLSSLRFCLGSPVKVSGSLRPLTAVNRGQVRRELWESTMNDKWLDYGTR